MKGVVSGTKRTSTQVTFKLSDLELDSDNTHGSTSWPTIQVSVCSLLFPFHFMELDSLLFQWSTVFDSLSGHLSTPSLTPCRLGFHLNHGAHWFTILIEPLRLVRSFWCLQSQAQCLRHSHLLSTAGSSLLVSFCRLWFLFVLWNLTPCRSNGVQSLTPCRTISPPQVWLLVAWVSS